MLRKIIDSLGYAGFILILLGYFYYSVYSQQWDWKAQALVLGGAVLLVVNIIANREKIGLFLKSRAARHGGAAGLSLLLVLGILVLLSFLNFRHHQRTDLTEAELFALSPQTRKVVSNLKTDISVLGFFQDESRARPFEDLLKEYHYLSRRLKYELVDPQKDPGRVTQYGVQRDGQVVIASGAKTETIDDFSEEKITNAIIKVTREGEKVAYFLQGHGERDFNETGAQGFSLARDGIQKLHYQVKGYNLAQENKLPADAAMIISAGPQVNFFPNEVDLLKQYLQGGGKFLLMVDPRTEFSMQEFISAFGLGLGNNVVLDSSGIGQLFGLGPAAPLVAEYADHPITKEVKDTMTFFPLAQSVTTQTSSLGYQTQTLLSTSSRSWGESNLEGQQASFDEGKDARGPLHLAAVATHKEEGSSQAGDEAAAEARFVLFGDSDFATNAYFNSAANGDLFVVTVGWLAAESDLMAIRPKDPKDRRVTMTLTESRLAFWGMVVALPLITLVGGIAVWFRRR